MGSIISIYRGVISTIFSGAMVDWLIESKYVFLMCSGTANDGSGLTESLKAMSRYKRFVKTSRENYRHSPKQCSRPIPRPVFSCVPYYAASGLSAVLRISLAHSFHICVRSQPLYFYCSIDMDGLCVAYSVFNTSFRVWAHSSNGEESGEFMPGGSDLHEGAGTTCLGLVGDPTIPSNKTPEKNNNTLPEICDGARLHNYRALGVAQYPSPC